MGKQAIKAEQKGKSVIYYYNDGTTEVRSGDNIAVKTNNPGNISAYSVESKKYGIGVYKRDSDNIFAIFPDVETGEKALREYLPRRYKDKTIEETIYIYAPPKYNNTEAYIKYIENKGLDRNLKISELTPEQFDTLVEAIMTIESGGKLKPRKSSIQSDIMPSNNQYYIVQPGDTLSKIAKKFNISLDDLIKANKIKDPNLIYPGQRIYIPGYQEKVRRNVQEGSRRIDPLVIDLDGDGIKLVNINQSNAMFDLTGSGFANKTGWISSGDAFLVWDRNNDNRINDISEMFGSATQSGFQALSLYDTNRDGRIDAFDDVFKNLKLWQDKNGDGRTDEGELLSLSVGLKILDMIFAFNKN